jgi:hypothetical protein
MKRKAHRTVRLKVWAEIDEGIANAVRRLQNIPGIITQSSCQGTINEGGQSPYLPYVMVTWRNLAAFDRVRQEFDVTLPKGSNMKWGYAHPVERIDSKKARKR